jgi:hypothetical protein
LAASRDAPAERPHVGSVSYLLLSALIAAAIIGIFFGVAFALLPKDHTVVAAGPVSPGEEETVSTAKATPSPGDPPATIVTPAGTAPDWLVRIRNDVWRRWPIRRSGTVGLGPFTLEARREILTKLQILEETVGALLFAKGGNRRNRKVVAIGHRGRTIQVQSASPEVAVSIRSSGEKPRNIYSRSY